jgi:hypothetical protein
MRMTTLQAVLLGMMIAWTPALLIMALLLWRAPTSSAASHGEPSNYNETARAG